MMLLPDAAATEQLARRLVALLPGDIAGWTILLRGELGTGKSTLARSFIHALGHEGAVPSPTYTLVEPYTLERGRVFHVDLYRIGSEEELQFLGWSDLDDGCRLIEWPQRVPSLRDTSDIEIELSYDAAGRRAEIKALSPRADHVVARLGTDPNT